MADPAIPAWLASLPLAPEYHPTETEFADPITFISRIERAAGAAGICKIIPPHPRPSKRHVLSNLHRSIPAVFTTRHQELGSRRRAFPPPVHKQVWQSGESYTLEQFEAKSRAFARTHLAGHKDISPLLIESLFWKATLERPIYVEYANDVPGSGFSPPGSEPGRRLSNSHWNLQAIARAPGSLTRFMPDDVQGVTSPMVYIGMLFSWFAWHVEDHDLHSMNFLHTGAPKTWYAVPAEYASTLEEIVRVQGYGGNVDRLEGFCMLGEKTTLLSPAILMASGVPCCRLVQYPGEYVVTFPRAYHVGFSHGFNCGEAANFATPQWLNVAKEAAVRRAAMNYLPMLSHQHLLYLLTMSFVSRIPRELLSDVRSSRLRDRKKEEREVMVKKAFLEDMMNENRLLCTLLAKDSASYVVLWEPELLPSANNGSLSFPSSQSLEEHGSMFEDNQREIFHSSCADKVLFHCRRGTTGVENGRHVETVNSNSVPYHSVSSAGIQKSSYGLEGGMGFNVETLQDIVDGGDDLPCGLNVASGSLTCLACGVLGYPLMAIMQPSARAERELFPLHYEEFHQNSGKSEHLNSTSNLPNTVRKLKSDYSKEVGIMSVAQSNLDSSCILHPESGDHAPSTEASNAGCGFGSLNVDPKERSSDFDITIEGVDGMVSLPSSAHPEESCSDGQQCWVRSKELKNSMLIKEKGSERGINKKWSTSNRSMRPGIFCLQHALEIEELLQCKGGGNMLIICHSDYNKIKAHAISVTEDIGIKFNCKDVPLESASPEDMNLINIAIDDDHDDHEDWTSKLGLNLRYCVKLRRQSSENQELPLALRGIFSNPSPTFISNLKWHSRKIRTPYKVIGTVESKPANDIKLEKDEPVRRSSNTDSLKEIEAYQSRNDIANKHSGDPRAGTLEELSNVKEMGELTDRATYVKKSGPAHFLNDHVESMCVSVPTLSAESTHLCTDAQPEAKINVSYDIDFAKSGDQMEDISTENLHSVPTLSVECTHLSTDVQPEAKISVSDDIDFARSGSSVPFVNSHIGACIHPNGLNRKMVVCNSVMSQCPSSEMLQDLLIAGKSCSNSRVCGLEKSEGQAGITATEDGQHEVVRGSDDNSSAHKFNEIINSVDGSSSGRAVDHSEVLPEVSASGEDDLEGRLCNSVCSDYESTSLSSSNNFETHLQVSVAEEAETDTAASSDNNSDARQLDEVQLHVSVGEETEPDTTASTDYDSDTRQPEVSVLRESVGKSQTYQEPDSASEMEENDTSSDMRQEVSCESELEGDCRIASSRRQKQVDSASENEVNGFVNSFEVQQERLCASETEERVNPVNSQKPSITLPSENMQSNVMHYLVETRTTDANATGDKDHCLENSTEECRSVAVYKTYFRKNKRKRETENTTGGCTSVQGLCEILTYVRKNKRKMETENTVDGGSFSRLPSKVLTYVRRNKRKKEIENTTNGGSTFMRGPCEGLRPRTGRTEFGQNEVRIANKEAAKRVKKPKRVDLPRGEVEKKGDHKCDIYKCGMRFKTQEELLLHKSNLCTFKGCGKHFSSHKYIVRHQIVHDDLRPLKCPWKDCNMSFKWSWARIEHIRTHTGERPYKCKVEGCGKTFRFVSAFSSHRRKSGHSVE